MAIHLHLQMPRGRKIRRCIARLPRLRLDTRRRRRQQGSLLLDAVLALGLYALFLVNFANQTEAALDMARGRQAALELNKVRDAAFRYVKAYYNAVLTAAGGGPINIPIATLQSAGFLPATFTNTNAYRQTYAVAVRQTGTGILEGLVFAGGGRAIEAKRLGLIAGLADEGMLVSPLSPTTVSGAYGSRQIPLAPYGATVAGLTTGRIAAPLDFDSSMFASDYLARVSLGSDVTPNTMATDLYMGNNTIFDAKDVELESLGRFVSNAAYDFAVVAPGTTLTKPVCPNGTPLTYAAVVTAFDGNASPKLMNSIQVPVTDNGASWTYSMVVGTEDGSITPSAASAARILAIRKCG